MDVKFTETETLIGHVVTASGSLLLADGSVQTALQLSQLDIVHLDVDKEQTKIPVYAVNQNGKRYLIVAIDDALPANYDVKEHVDVSDPVEYPNNKTDGETDE